MDTELITRIRNISIEELKSKRQTIFLHNVDINGNFIIKKKWTNLSKKEKISNLINYTIINKNIIALNKLTIKNYLYKNIIFDINTQCIISVNIIPK